LISTMRAFQESRVLLTAVELDLFSAVGAGAAAAEVAAALRTDPRATETLLNAVTALGALTKRQETFHNTPETARFLVTGSPENTRPALLHTVHMFDAWATLTECVRAGTATGRPGIEQRDSKWTEAFIAAMHRIAADTAPDMVRAVGAEGIGRLLDVGGGSGAYAIAFAQADPDLRAEILDRPEVLPIAQRHIEEAGLTGRIGLRAGDLTKDDLGEGYDLILLSAICHMLSPKENRDLLRRCFRALAAGGRVAIRDFILEPGKTAPKPAALFAINMLVATRGGSSYSEAEYRAWLSEAGFRRIVRLEPDGDLLAATREGKDLKS
jgi:predicted O-methyltransferase YrrM